MLEHVAEDVAQLKHVLLEGNGSPPLMVAVATQDERLKTLESKESGLSVKEKGAVYSALGISLLHALARMMGHL